MVFESLLVAAGLTAVDGIVAVVMVDCLGASSAIKKQESCRSCSGGANRPPTWLVDGWRSAGRRRSSFGAVDALNRWNRRRVSCLHGREELFCRFQLSGSAK